MELQAQKTALEQSVKQQGSETLQAQQKLQLI